MVWPENKIIMIQIEEMQEYKVGVRHGIRAASHLIQEINIKTMTLNQFLSMACRVPYAPNPPTWLRDSEQHEIYAKGFKCSVEESFNVELIITGA